MIFEERIGAIQPTESFFRIGGHQLFKAWWEKTYPEVQLPSEAVQIGAGAEGQVFKLESADIVIAVKTPKSISEAHYITQEGEKLQALQGVPGVVEYLQHHAGQFVVMKLVNGTGYYDYLNLPENKNVSPAELGRKKLSIAKQLLNTYREAAKRGIFIIDIGLDSNTFIRDSADFEDKSQPETTLIDVAASITTAAELPEFDRRIKNLEEDFVIRLYKQASADAETRKTAVEEFVKKIIGKLSATDQEILDSTIKKIADDALKTELQTQIAAVEKPVGGLFAGMAAFFKGEQAEDLPNIWNLNKLVSDYNSSFSQVTMYESQYRAKQDELAKLRTAAEDLRANPGHLYRVLQEHKDLLRSTTIDVYNRTQKLSEFSQDLAVMALQVLCGFDDYLSKDSLKTAQEIQENLKRYGFKIDILQAESVLTILKTGGDPLQTLETLETVLSAVSITETVQSPVLPSPEVIETAKPYFELLDPRKDDRERRKQRAQVVGDYYDRTSTSLQSEIDVNQKAEKYLAFAELLFAMYVGGSATGKDLSGDVMPDYLALTGTGFVHQGEDVAMRFVKKYQDLKTVAEISPTDHAKLTQATDILNEAMIALVDYARYGHLAGGYFGNFIVE